MPDDFTHQLEKNLKPVTYEQFLMASFYDKFHLFVFTGNIANRKIGMGYLYGSTKKIWLINFRAFMWLHASNPLL